MRGKSKRKGDSAKIFLGTTTTKSIQVFEVSQK